MYRGNNSWYKNKEIDTMKDNTSTNMTLKDCIGFSKSKQPFEYII